MDRISGKTVVVTGAASGFGRILCERLLGRGARVAAGDINEAGLAELAAGHPASSLLTQVTNVAELAQQKALVAAALARFGAVDVLVNNAGTMPLAFFSDHEQAVAAWDRCIDVNIRGVLYGMIAAFDPMMTAGQGQVINLSSIYGNYPTIGAAVYGASKAAVDFLSESFRQETRGKIKVTVIKPTGVPATNLSSNIVNPEAPKGIWGHYLAEDGPRFEALATGQLPAREQDPESPAYFALSPEYIVEAILHAIDQPLGVSVSSVTVRATGDGYVL